LLSFRYNPIDYSGEGGDEMRAYFEEPMARNLCDSFVLGRLPWRYDDIVSLVAWRESRECLTIGFADVARCGPTK
jgi:hypothetical protein